MEPAPDTFILSVPGTDQTRELSREGLMRELITGEITSDFWVWSPADSDWKQISQLPSLLEPAPPAQPAPIPRLTVSPASLPKDTTAPAPVSKVIVNPPALSREAAAPISKVTVNPNPLAREAMVTPSGIGKVTVNPAPIPRGPETTAETAKAPFMPISKATPAPEPAAKAPPAVAPIKKQLTPQQAAYKANVAAAKKPNLIRRNPKIEDHEHDDGLPYMKIAFGLLYVAVAAVIAANYILIDKKFDDALAHTPFVLVQAHAHLGSFVQPNALVIHILPSADLTQDNLADYLQILAKNTPDQPLKGGVFSTVALSPAWFGLYLLRGDDWKDLGKMDNASTDDRKDFIADHLFTLAGQQVIHNAAVMAPAQLKDARLHAWQDLASKFVGRS